MDAEKNSKRKYELRQRAEEMARTRRRITEAAVHLHGTVGPARTTISAIAEQAGVQRHTVYRHFPTDADLYGACSARYFTAHPLPDAEPWRTIRDPRQRLARALGELYAYYEKTEPMFSKVYRDLDLIDALKPTIAPFGEYLTRVAEILGRDWAASDRGRPLLAAALRHVLDFRTWHSLTASDQMTRADAICLATALADAAAALDNRRHAAVDVDDLSGDEIGRG